MIEKFSLLHAALYSKHWYKKCSGKNTIWDDLKKTMSADGYNGEHMTKGDIVQVMLHQCQLINHRAVTDLTEFVSGISKEGCWRHGYFTKDNTPFQHKNEVLEEYDFYEAIVRYCLSSICMLSAEELGGVVLPAPDYINVLPMRIDI